MGSTPRKESYLKKLLRKCEERHKRLEERHNNALRELEHVSQSQTNYDQEPMIPDHIRAPPKQRHHSRHDSMMQPNPCNCSNVDILPDQLFSFCVPPYVNMSTSQTGGSYLFVKCPKLKGKTSKKRTREKDSIPTKDRPTSEPTPVGFGHGKLSEEIARNPSKDIQEKMSRGSQPDTTTNVDASIPVGEDIVKPDYPLTDKQSGVCNEKSLSVITAQELRGLDTLDVPLEGNRSLTANCENVEKKNSIIESLRSGSKTNELFPVDVTMIDEFVTEKPHDDVEERECSDEPPVILHAENEVTPPIECPDEGPGIVHTKSKVTSADMTLTFKHQSFCICPLCECKEPESLDIGVVDIPTVTAMIPAEIEIQPTDTTNVRDSLVLTPTSSVHQNTEDEDSSDTCMCETCKSIEECQERLRSLSIKKPSLPTQYEHLDEEKLKETQILDIEYFPEEPIQYNTSQIVDESCKITEQPIIDEFQNMHSPFCSCAICECPDAGSLQNVSDMATFEQCDEAHETYGYTKPDEPAMDVDVPVQEEIEENYNQLCPCKTCVCIPATLEEFVTDVGVPFDNEIPDHDVQCSNDALEDLDTDMTVPLDNVIEEHDIQCSANALDEFDLNVDVPVDDGSTEHDSQCSAATLDELGVYDDVPANDEFADHDSQCSANELHEIDINLAELVEEGIADMECAGMLLTTNEEIIPKVDLGGILESDNISIREEYVPSEPQLTKQKSKAISRSTTSLKVEDFKTDEKDLEDVFDQDQVPIICCNCGCRQSMPLKSKIIKKRSISLQSTIAQHVETRSTSSLDMDTYVIEAPEPMEGVNRVASVAKTHSKTVSFTAVPSVTDPVKPVPSKTHSVRSDIEPIQTVPSQTQSVKSLKEPLETVPSQTQSIKSQTEPLVSVLSKTRSVKSITEPLESVPSLTRSVKSQTEPLETVPSQTQSIKSQREPLESVPSPIRSVKSQTEPLETVPSQTQSIKSQTEPLETVPSQTQSIKSQTEPLETVPSQTQSIKSQTEPLETVLSQTQSIKSQNEPLETVPSQTQSIKSQTVPLETVPSQAQSVKTLTEPLETVPSKTQSIQSQTEPLESTPSQTRSVKSQTESLETVPLHNQSIKSQSEPDESISLTTEPLPEHPSDRPCYCKKAKRPIAPEQPIKLPCNCYKARQKAQYLIECAPSKAELKPLPPSKPDSLAITDTPSKPDSLAITDTPSKPDSLAITDTPSKPDSLAITDSPSHSGFANSDNGLLETVPSQSSQTVRPQNGVADTVPSTTEPVPDDSSAPPCCCNISLSTIETDSPAQPPCYCSKFDHPTGPEPCNCYKSRLRAQRLQECSPSETELANLPPSTPQSNTVTGSSSTNEPDTNDRSSCHSVKSKLSENYVHEMTIESDQTKETCCNMEEDDSSVQETIVTGENVSHNEDVELKSDLMEKQELPEVSETCCAMEQNDSTLKESTCPSQTRPSREPSHQKETTVVPSPQTSKTDPPPSVEREPVTLHESGQATMTQNGPIPFIAFQTGQITFNLQQGIPQMQNVQQAPFQTIQVVQSLLPNLEFVQHLPMPPNTGSPSINVQPQISSYPQVQPLFSTVIMGNMVNNSTSGSPSYPGQSVFSTVVMGSTPNPPNPFGITVVNNILIGNAQYPPSTNQATHTDIPPGSTQRPSPSPSPHKPSTVSVTSTLQPSPVNEASGPGPTTVDEPDLNNGAPLEAVIPENECPDSPDAIDTHYVNKDVEDGLEENNDTVCFCEDCRCSSHELDEFDGNVLDSPYLHADKPSVPDDQVQPSTEEEAIPSEDVMCLPNKHSLVEIPVAGGQPSIAAMSLSQIPICKDIPLEEVPLIKSSPSVNEAELPRKSTGVSADDSDQVQESPVDLETSEICICESHSCCETDDSSTSLEQNPSDNACTCDHICSCSSNNLSIHGNEPPEPNIKPMSKTPSVISPSNTGPVKAESLAAALSKTGTSKTESLAVATTKTGISKLESLAAAPSKTEPSKTGSLAAVPSKTGPSKTESLVAAPSKTGPSKTESLAAAQSKTGPSRTESLAAAPSKTGTSKRVSIVDAPSKTGPSKTESLVAAPSKTGPSKTEYLVAAPSKTGPSKTESLVAAPSKTGPSRTESLAAAPSKTGTSKRVSLVAAPSKTGTSKTESLAAAPSKTGSSKTESIVAATSKTGTSKTESLAAAPSKTGSSKTESLAAAPSKTGSSKTESLAAAPSKTGSSKSESLVAAPSKTGSSKTESLAAAPSKTGTSKTESLAAAPSKTGTSKTESLAAAPSKTGSSKTESLAAAPSKTGSSKTESLAAATSKTGTSKTESLAAAPSKTGSSKTKSLAASPSKTGASKTESIVDAPSKTGSTKTESLVAAPSKTGPSKTESLVAAPSKTGSSKPESVFAEPPVKEQDVSNQSHTELAASDLEHNKSDISIPENFESAVSLIESGEPEDTVASPTEADVVIPAPTESSVSQPELTKSPSAFKETVPELAGPTGSLTVSLLEGQISKLSGELASLRRLTSDLAKESSLFSTETGEEQTGSVGPEPAVSAPSVAPPSESEEPPTTSEAPPTLSEAPPTTSEAPPTSRAAPSQFLPESPSELRAALLSMQVKQHAKDQMIQSLAEELKMRAGSNVWEQLLAKVADPQGKPIDDFDRAHLASFMSRPKLPPLTQQRYRNLRPGYTAPNSGPPQEGVEEPFHGPISVKIVQRILATDLLVEWDVPENNVVVGYEVFVNGAYSQKVRSGDRHMTVLHNIDFDSVVKVTVYALTRHGRIDKIPGHAILNPQAETIMNVTDYTTASH